MSLDIFEIGSFPTDYVVVSEDTTFEYAEAVLFDDPYQIWNLVFEFELPEETFVLADSTYDEEYPFALTDTFNVPYLMDYILSETAFIEDKYEELGGEFIGRWDEKDVDENYTFTMLLWAMYVNEEFPIVFYNYPLAQTEYFDFGNVIYRYPTTADEFSFDLPTIYFTNPYFVEEFGDLLYKVVTSDEYPELVHDWWKVSEDSVLDNLVPYTLFNTAADTELFPNLISVYALVDSFDIEPNPVATWKTVFTDEFFVIPPIYQYRFLPFTKDTDTFDIESFLLVYSEYFEFPASYIIKFTDYFDFIDVIIKTEDTFELSKPKVFIEDKWHRVLPIENFRLQRVVDPFIDWTQLNFNTWFDFEDFDCREFKVDTSCPVRVLEDFEIAAEFNVAFTVAAIDTFEFEDYGAFTFALSLNDSFYAFETWTMMGVDKFEFNPSGFTLSPIDISQLGIYPPTLYWDFFPPTLDSFDTPVDTFYLEHVTEFFSFVIAPHSFRLFLEDNIEDVLINIPEDMITLSTELPVKLNNKLVGYTYRGNGYMKGYAYLDYEGQPAETMADRLKTLENREYRPVDTEEFEIFSITDSILCDVEYVLHKKPQIGMNGTDTIYVLDEYRYRSNYNITH